MNPFAFARFHPLPLSEIRPAGWLHDFLKRQATGLTGNIAVAGYPYGYPFWGSAEGDLKGSYDAWWPYEQTAYWIDGALKCGYLVGDADLYAQALAEVDFAIEHAAADGFIGPEHLRAKDRWPHTVFFRAVLAQYEISGDARYLEALIRHYRAMPPLPAKRGSGFAGPGGDALRALQRAVAAARLRASDAAFRQADHRARRHLQRGSQTRGLAVWRDRQRRLSTRRSSRLRQTRTAGGARGWAAFLLRARAGAGCPRYA